MSARFNPILSARVRMHLQFAVGYRQQVKLDREAGLEGCATFCEAQRRKHQKQLADIRARRGASQ